MTRTTTHTSPQMPTATADGHRARLLRGVPVSQRQVVAAGIPTAVVEGGEGSPVVLLHGPGESAVNWRWTIPSLVSTHRVIAPDLPPTAPPAPAMPPSTPAAPSSGWTS